MVSLSLLGSVNTEGGPVLILDAALARAWSGIEGSDYARACEPFDHDPSLETTDLLVNGGGAVAWEMGGAGTVDVFRSETGFLLARYWLTDPRSSEERWSLLLLPLQAKSSGAGLRVQSSRVCVAWAAVSGEDVVDPSGPSPSTNSDRTAVLFDLEPGDYECSVDTASAGAARVRRCLFSRRSRVR